MFTVDEVLHKHYPQVANNPWLFKSLSFVLRHLLHEREITEFGETYPHYEDIDFVEQVLEYFNISYSTRDVEKERIPTEGRVVIIANHPIGSLDALALIKLVSEVRHDLKVVANQMLMAIEPLHDMLLPVNNMQGGTPKQHLADIQSHLTNDGAILIFPAGEVSRLRPQGVRDTRWHSGFLRIARLAKAPILPVYIDAKNSPLFYGVSMVYKPLATALLVKEMFKQRKKHLPMRIGELIPHGSYNTAAISLKDQVKLFKRHLYRIGHNKKGIFETQAAIAPPEDKKELSRAIKQCEHLGQTSDGKSIFLYQHSGCSPIMREIGRLREIAFRAVGEGTNKRRDIDQYDSHYYHLVLWDDSDLEIVGAYRFGDAQILSDKAHPTGLYSATLFDYSENNQTMFNSGLELGRSFVQPRYWGKRSLDYLWFGIGAFLNRYPKYQFLFGPVSLSNAYPAPAKDLIVQFYSTYFPKQFGEAKSKRPYSVSQDVLHTFQGSDYKKEFTLLKHLLANMGVNVPTLYKQYSEVCKKGGVAFLDFNVDPDFCDCIDGLVVVDLNLLTDKKRKRYLAETSLKATA
ncbi:lysophospholipid acyltransferase family protein [Alteromonas sp. KUL49]|uniref:GNAT family N-acyltransferase n=1 Tax=Alteromonas sp. KUL49 TaxID=2480798 RepID=UPI00102F186B|nr:lysophospholipid acyltransferase family protein [Alteromonas sp. KUL49]TAP39834.1 lysophospholipid acyltransferase family protein [Alteromonas sp. KUL49]GEA11844.1 acyltransferase [Alteromonas sp. KUL49]